MYRIGSFVLSFAASFLCLHHSAFFDNIFHYCISFYPIYTTIFIRQRCLQVRVWFEKISVMCSFASHKCFILVHHFIIRKHMILNNKKKQIKHLSLLVQPKVMFNTFLSKTSFSRNNYGPENWWKESSTKLKFCIHQIFSSFLSNPSVNQIKHRHTKYRHSVKARSLTWLYISISGSEWCINYYFFGVLAMKWVALANTLQRRRKTRSVRWKRCKNAMIFPFMDVPTLYFYVLPLTRYSLFQ